MVESKYNESFPERVMDFARAVTPSLVALCCNWDRKRLPLNCSLTTRSVRGSSKVLKGSKAVLLKGCPSVQNDFVTVVRRERQVAEPPLPVRGW